MFRFPKTSSMLTDALSTLALRGIGILLMFASTTLTARLLGPEEYGAYTAALSLALLFATIAPMGSDRILVRNLSTVSGSEEAGCETAIAHVCTAIAAIVLLLGSLGAWLISDLVPGSVKWAQTSLMAAIMFIPLTAIYLRQWTAIPIIGTRRAVMPEQTFLPLIFTPAILLIASLGWELSALATSVVYSVVLLAVWAGSLRTGALRAVYLSAWNARRNADLPAIGRQLREGLPFVSLAIGAVMSLSCMPLVIATTCGFAESGYFALAMPYAVLAAVPLGVFNLSLIPRCARHFKNGEFAAASHAVRSAATATFVFGSVISIVVWQSSPFLIRLLGEDYSTVCRLLPPLLLASLVDCLTGPTFPVMQTMRMEVSYTRGLFGYIPIQLFLVWSFGHIAGIEGAAVGYLLARLLWNAFVLIRIYQIRGLILLPYLSASKALREFPTVAEHESSHLQLQQRFRNVSAMERPVAPKRAA